MRRTHVVTSALLFAVIATAANAEVQDPSATPAPSAASTASATGGSWVLPAVQGLPGTIPPQVQADVRRHMAEFGRLAAEQQRFRQDMLGALTPAHRALLAQIVGELAVAPVPDATTAAQRLDAALSPAEAQTVLRVQQAQEAAALRQMQQMQAESIAVELPAGNKAPAMQSSTIIAHASSPSENDAGWILLRTAVMGIMMPRLSAIRF